MWGNGIGLLGISGKYGKIQNDKKLECLDFIINSYDYIDTASVYGENDPINAHLVSILRKKEKKNYPKIINKIGANLVHTEIALELIEEFKEQQNLFKEFTMSAIFLHRPAKNLLDRDFYFHSYLKDNFPEINFGICTNNLEIFDLYSERMRIDSLQIAVNLLDYKNNLELLKKAKKKNIKIFARSCLSSGLLSGKYLDLSDCNFTDPLRSRFIDNERNKQILHSRIEAVKEIKTFYSSCLANKNLSENCSLTHFVYSLIKQSPYVDEVIKGGSNLNQLKENSKKPNLLTNEIIEDVYNKYTINWSSPYL